ncbi:unnamed protein product [Jaminaea pallidilutea]
MNDVVATAFAVLLIYLVLKFAFGSNSNPNRVQGVDAHSASLSRGEHPMHSNPTSGAGGGSKGNSSSKATLISRFGLENRIGREASGDDESIGDDSFVSDASSTTLASGGGTQSTEKGKGKMTDEDWKKRADARKGELRKRKEEMILEARRKLIAKQQRASLDSPGT